MDSSPIMEYLSYEIYAGITVSHVIGIVFAIIIVRLILRNLFPKERPDVYIKARCPKCDWTGEVSKYHAVCRKCGNENVQKLPSE